MRLKPVLGLETSTYIESTNVDKDLAQNESGHTAVLEEPVEKSHKANPEAQNIFTARMLVNKETSTKPTINNLVKGIDMEVIATLQTNTPEDEKFFSLIAELDNGTPLYDACRKDEIGPDTVKKLFINFLKENKLNDLSESVGDLIRQAPADRSTVDYKLEGYYLDKAFETVSTDTDLLNIADYIKANKDKINNLIDNIAPFDDTGHGVLHKAIFKVLTLEDPSISNAKKQKPISTVDGFKEKLEELKLVANLKESGVESELIGRLLNRYSDLKKGLNPAAQITQDATKKLNSDIAPEELNGFIRYSLASLDNRVLVDKLSTKFAGDGPEYSTFNFKGNVIKFLEVRAKKEDKEAVKFLKDICELKSVQYDDNSTIDGVDRLLNRILDERNLNASDELIGGYYTEANVALSLIEQGDQVTHISVDFDFDENGKPIINDEGNKEELKDNFGVSREIDIILKDLAGNKYFVEIKTTGHVLHEKNFYLNNTPKSRPQAVGLAQIAQRKNATYVSALERGNNDDPKLQEKVIQVRQLVKDKTGIEIPIWNSYGDDITGKFPI